MTEFGLPTESYVTGVKHPAPDALKYVVRCRVPTPCYINHVRTTYMHHYPSWFIQHDAADSSPSTPGSPPSYWRQCPFGSGFALGTAPRRNASRQVAAPQEGRTPWQGDNPVLHVRCPGRPLHGSPLRRIRLSCIRGSHPWNSITLPPLDLRYRSGGACLSMDLGFQRADHRHHEPMAFDWSSASACRHPGTAAHPDGVARCPFDCRTRYGLSPAPQAVADVVASSRSPFPCWAREKAAGQSTARPSC